MGAGLIIVLITQMVITVLLMLETSSRLNFKDSIQFSVFTSSLVLLLSTLLNHFIIVKQLLLLNNAIQTHNNTVLYTLRGEFLFWHIIGEFVGSNNLPYILQALIMILFYYALKGYIRRMMESSNIITPIVPVGSPYPYPQQYPYPLKPATPQQFTLGQTDNAPSLADLERLKRMNQEQMVKNIPQKLVEASKIGLRGTIEVIGENKKFKDEPEGDSESAIIPDSIEKKITQIVQNEENSTVSGEIMEEQLKKKKEQEKKEIKEYASLIKPEVDVSVKIDDKDYAWSLAIDTLQGYVINQLLLPPEISTDYRRYRVLQVVNKSKEGYYLFKVEFTYSYNTKYYFDVYVLNNGEVKVLMRDVMKF